MVRHRAYGDVDPLLGDEMNRPTLFLLLCALTLGLGCALARGWEWYCLRWQRVEVKHVR